MVTVTVESLTRDEIAPRLIEVAIGLAFIAMTWYFVRAGQAGAALAVWVTTGILVLYGMHTMRSRVARASGYATLLYPVSYTITPEALQTTSKYSFGEDKWALFHGWANTPDSIVIVYKNGAPLTLPKRYIAEIDAAVAALTKALGPAMESQ